jgi:hypothetical protein
MYQFWVHISSVVKGKDEEISLALGPLKEEDVKQKVTPLFTLERRKKRWTLVLFNVSVC